MANLLLPIDPHLPTIASHLRSANRLVLQATPGSGKTTRVAPYLLDHLVDPDKQVWVLEPRRLAARMAATRVALERGQEVGEEIGYLFRWEQALGPRTRIRFLTEGTLPRLLKQDPDLKKVSVVILDEFHERHLQGDLVLALMLELQRTRRPDLKLLLMSATLDSAFFRTMLDCEAVTVEGRLYPIEIRHEPPASGKYIEEAIGRIIRDEWRAHGQDCGDFLVFLPGIAEIRRVETLLSPMMAKVGGYVCALHGDMDRDLQRKAVERGGGKKVILATNVAESSVTIDGIRVVIDTGLCRVYSDDASTGMPSLRTQKTSKSSCVQRANRAGRVGPGRVIRLFSESDYHGRPEADTPEILRTDLAPTLLDLRALGYHERNLSWPSVVPADRWKTAETFLRTLGAIDTNGDLLPTGQQMSSLPLSPRLARFLIQAQREGVIDAATSVAAVLSEGKIPDVDLLELAHQNRAPRRVRDSLRKFFPPSPALSPKITADMHDKLARCLVCAFPDRIAQRRGPFGKKEESFLLSESGSASMSFHPVLGDHEFFVVPALQKSESLRTATARAKVLAICPIEAEWLLDLPHGLLCSEQDYMWDEKGKRLTYRSVLRYGALTLESRDKPVPQDLATSEAFATLALGVNRADFASAPPRYWLEKIRARTDVSNAEQEAYRLAFWLKHHPHGKSEAVAQDGFWSERFLEALQGVTSMDTLRTLDWTLLFPANKYDSIQRFAPSHLVLGKRRAKIWYNLDQDPWVESRLQDFFGLTTSPTVGEGRVPLTLHLLAPNQRAVQVTRDLVSFWKKTYPELRKQLSRRYPRHPWPEDPLSPSSGTEHS